MNKSELLTPKYRFKSVLDVTADDLRKMGAKAVGLDIDNTVAPDGTTDFLPGAKEWVAEITGQGIPITVISNGSARRVGSIAEYLGGLPFVHFARKPSPRGLLKAARDMGVDITELAMLGDQLFSDIKAANRCGAIAVRIDPIDAPNRYPLYYKWRHKQERPYIEAFESKHGYGVYTED